MNQGIVSAVANNSLCGVGIAFKAKIGGIRILDGDIRDEVSDFNSQSFKNLVHFRNRIYITFPIQNGHNLWIQRL